MQSALSRLHLGRWHLGLSDDDDVRASRSCVAASGQMLLDLAYCKGQHSRRRAAGARRQREANCVESSERNGARKLGRCTVSGAYAERGEAAASQPVTVF